MGGHGVRGLASPHPILCATPPAQGGIQILGVVSCLSLSTAPCIWQSLVRCSPWFDSGYILCQFTAAFVAQLYYVAIITPVIHFCMDSLAWYASVHLSDKVVLPGVGQRLALMVQTVLKPVQFSVMDVDMPAAGQRLALMVQTVQSPVEFPQVQFLVWDVDMQSLALMVQTVQMPVKVPQVQNLDKDVLMPVIVPTAAFLGQGC